MREIRTSGSMSGDGKRDHDAPGVQSTRARPRLYPRGEAKCVGGPSVRDARRLTSGGVLDSTLSKASNGAPIACFDPLLCVLNS